jgi:hypothetical protein
MVSGSISRQKFIAVLIGLFAVVASALAEVGLYGVIASGVSHGRTSWACAWRWARRAAV